MQFDESVTAIDSTKYNGEDRETIVVGLERKKSWNAIRSLEILIEVGILPR